VVPKESVDWRAEGVVGPIKNQHVNGSKCGCCWSFATVGVVESINALATGHLDVLSEQQLIACDMKGERAGSREYCCWIPPSNERGWEGLGAEP
jgi:hypothetical protein